MRLKDFRTFCFSFLVLALAFGFVETHTVAFAQARKALRKKSAGKKSQTAIVGVEGAAVYKYPNFDAQVLEYVRAGTKVRATLKPRAGIGGFGAFYKVKLPNGKIGWMTDVDILPQYKVGKSPRSRNQSNPDFDNAKDMMENAGREQVYFERYVGANFGIVDFSEKFDKKILSANTPMFGLRGVGPGLLFDGPPLDLSVQFSMQAPSYYSEFASADATGFFLIADAMFPFPFISSDSYYVGLGLGPMISYTNFSLRVRSSPFDSQEVRLGAVADLGAMFRYKKLGFKLDYKYYYEVTQYGGIHLSILYNVR
jgi:hypothetical protein